MSIGIERADYMWRKGRIAVLSIGPLRFYVNTADEGSIAFSVILGCWELQWSAGRVEP